MPRSHGRKRWSAGCTARLACGPTGSTRCGSRRRLSTVSPRPTARRRISTIIILTSEMANRGVIPDEIIGFAAVERGVGGRVAYVIYDRVRNFASDTEVDDMRMMGIVMAHEIGHLLLTHQSHSDSGAHARTLATVRVPCRPPHRSPVFRASGSGDSENAWRGDGAVRHQEPCCADTRLRRSRAGCLGGAA